MASKRTSLMRALLVCGSALTTVCASSALAQDTAGAAPADQAAAPELGDIVVTAQKRSESILNVPAGVSVISPDALEALHATQLTDVSSYVPAFQVDSGGTPGQTTISMRGIAPIGRGSTVATYIDDAPVGSSSSYGGGNAFQLDLLPYDVERFEILRGPQGTLYGASSMGGLLKYVLSSPSLSRFSVRGGGDVQSVEGGGKIGGGFRANVSGPLARDTLGFVASYALERTPGYIDNAVTGRRDQNAVLQQSGRVGLYWQPSDAFGVKVNGLYQRTKADGNATSPLSDVTLRPIYPDLTDDNLIAEPFEKKIAFVSAAATYHGGSIDVVSSTSYSDTKTRQIQDASYTYGVAFPFFGLPAGKSVYTYRLHLKKFTQEVRVQSTGTGPLQWTIGGFYTHEDSSNFQSPSALTMAGVSIPGVDPLFVGNLPSTYEEYAAFANLNLSITNRLELFGGVREAENHQTFSEIGSGSIIPPINLVDQKSKEDVFTYSGGLRFKPDSRTMLYVRVASGYRPGGPNLAIPGVSPTFKSDSLTNYELGLKTRSPDGMVSLEAAAFRIDWSDIQLLTSAGAGFNYAVNGGKARSQGLEADVAVRPAGGFELNGTFAYVDSVLTEDVPLVGGRDGDRLPAVPKVSGSVAATYTADLSNAWKGTLGAAVRIVDERFSSVESAPDSRRLPGYSALDLNASVTDGRYTFRIFAKNATDTRAYSTYNLLNNQATAAVTQINAAIIQPRTIGAAVDVHF